MIDKIALAVVIIGAINWAFIGVFGIDLVALLFGGQLSLMSRIVLYHLYHLNTLYGYLVHNIETIIFFK